MKREFRLSGAGGQGLGLAGVILAEAATIFEDLNVVQSQSYGPEARGGASKSDVIISDTDIDFPKATNIELLLALTQESCDKYVKDLKPGGILVVDDELVTDPPTGNFTLYKCPFIREARDVLRKSFVANIIALGTIVGISGVVKKESLEQAVLSRVPKGTEDLNLTALKIGLEMSEKLLKGEPLDNTNNVHSNG